MKYTFDQYFEWLMGWEGEVYENDPDDPGGETKFGIDKSTHRDVNIKKLTRAGAKQIYYDFYWLPVGADKLPPKTAWVVVDAGVNCGKDTSVGWLQKAVGTTVDRRVGPITLKAAKDFKDDYALALTLLLRREEYYRNLGKQMRYKKYLRGWLNRNNDLHKILTQ